MKSLEQSKTWKRNCVDEVLRTVKTRKRTCVDEVLGAVKNVEKTKSEQELRGTIKTIQTTALLKSFKMFRDVLEN